MVINDNCILHNELSIEFIVCENHLSVEFGPMGKSAAISDRKSDEEYMVKVNQRF
jgi:hypothetical protein